MTTETVKPALDFTDLLSKLIGASESIDQNTKQELLNNLTGTSTQATTTQADTQNLQTQQQQGTTQTTGNTVSTSTTGQQSSTTKDAATTNVARSEGVTSSNIDQTQKTVADLSNLIQVFQQQNQGIAPDQLKSLFTEGSKAAPGLVSAYANAAGARASGNTPLQTALGDLLGKITLQAADMNRLQLNESGRTAQAIAELSKQLITTGTQAQTQQAATTNTGTSQETQAGTATTNVSAQQSTMQEQLQQLLNTLQSATQSTSATNVVGTKNESTSQLVDSQLTQQKDIGINTGNLGKVAGGALLYDALKGLSGGDSVLGGVLSKIWNAAKGTNSTINLDDPTTWSAVLTQEETIALQNAISNSDIQALLANIKLPDLDFTNLFDSATPDNSWDLPGLTEADLVPWWEELPGFRDGGKVEATKNIITPELPQIAKGGDELLDGLLEVALKTSTTGLSLQTLLDQVIGSPAKGGTPGTATPFDPNAAAMGADVSTGTPGSVAANSAAVAGFVGMSPVGVLGKGANALANALNSVLAPITEALEAANTDPSAPAPTDLGFFNDVAGNLGGTTGSTSSTDGYGFGLDNGNTGHGEFGGDSSGDGSDGADGSGPGEGADGASPGIKNGGKITGPGTATSDSILARLSNGEYVIPADVVSKVGDDFFDSMIAALHTPAK